MKTVRHLLFAVAAALAIVPALASASTTAKVTVLHGIRGQDLGLAAELPVDVYVNGNLTLEDFEFSDQVTVDLPAGSYEIDINLANQAAPVIEVSVNLLAKERSTIVAHLKADGTPSASKIRALSQFGGAGFAPGQFVHAAAAPAVDVFFKLGNRAYYPQITNLRNGNSETEILNLFNTDVAVAAAGTLNFVLGPADITSLLAPNKAYQFFVVGSLNGASGNTLTVLRVEL